MAKKNKDQVPNANSVANRDIIQRLNFLYQASTYLDTLQTPNIASTVDGTSNSGATTQKSNRSKRLMSAKDLSRNYIRTMKIVGQKTTVKMDPTVKRTICKGCNTVLVPGATAYVRVKPSLSHRHAVAYTCLACKTTRLIPAPPTLHLDPMSTPGDPQPPLEELVPTADSPQTVNKRRKKKTPAPRLLPLFARPVGHVVLRGNEKLEEDENVGGTFVA